MWPCLDFESLLVSASGRVGRWVGNQPLLTATVPLLMSGTFEINQLNRVRRYETVDLVNDRKLISATYCFQIDLLMGESIGSQSRY